MDPSLTQASTLPPKAVKKMEKEIVNEGKHEEHQLKNVVKDLQFSEKEEHKIHKVCRVSSFPSLFVC